MFKELSKGHKIILFIGFVLGVFSIVLAKFDTSFKDIWLGLTTRFLFFCLFLVVYFSSFKEEQIKDFIKKVNPKIFLFILLLALITRFLYLQQYPFCSIGDEVRDAGLNAQKIFSGEIKNVFGYGNYNGFGLGIPLFSSYFYRIFSNSVLTYRVPAALTSILGISLIYFLCVLLFNNGVAFWASMIMISSWWHLYLSRTELVVILDSFATTLILLSFFLLTKRKKIIDFALLGTVLGFSLGLHAAVRVFLVLIPLILFNLFFLQKEIFKLKLKKTLVLVVFFFIGFGPRIWNSDLNILFQSNKSYSFALKVNSFLEILHRYGKSLLVWFKEPLQTRYPGTSPVFPLILFSFFVIGFFYLFLAFRKRVKFLSVLYFFIFLIPLTNSALTDTLNFGHRLVPLLPLGSIFAGVGIYFFLSKIKWRIAKRITTAVIFLYLIFNLFNFFYKKPANLNNKPSDFLSTHLIYFLKERPLPEEGKICLALSPENYSSFNLMHYKEQYEYFFPNTIFERRTEILLSDSEVYMFEGGCSNYVLPIHNRILGQKVFKIDCSGSNNFFCPLNNKTEFKIYY